MESIKRNKILIIGSLVAIIIIFSSADFISIYTSTSRLNSFWTHQSDYQKNESDKELTFTYSNSTDTVDFHVSTMKNDLQIEIDDCRNLRVSMDKSIKVGLSRFIPIYKITKFDSDFDIQWSGQIKNEDNYIKVSKSGKFKIDGNFKILGICSAKKTKEIIRAKLLEQAREMVSKDVQNEIEKMKTDGNII